MSLEMLNVIAVNAVSSLEICVSSLEICVPHLIYTNVLSRSMKLSTFLYSKICQLFIPIYRSIPSFAVAKVFLNGERLQTKGIVRHNLM